MLEAPEWQDLDRGALEEDEALERFLQRLPEDKEAVRRIFPGLFEELRPIEKHVALLPLLKASGKRLFVLSNFSRRGYAFVSSRYDFFRHFDGGVVSYEVKLLKPEREIYEALIDRYALDPSTCLFFDDREENVAAALDQLASRGDASAAVTSQNDSRLQIANIANRLQAALWREAVHLVAEGVASVADVDAAISEGPGLRWALMGPHATFHLAGGEGGIDHFLHHLLPAVTSWWGDLGQEATVAEAVQRALVQGVAEETGGASTAELARRRDAALVRLLEARNAGTLPIG